MRKAAGWFVRSLSSWITGGSFLFVAAGLLALPASATDTDLDGLDDSIDLEPVSRAVSLWGDPLYTAGATNVYPRPAWAPLALASGGAASTNPSPAWVLGPDDALLVFLDRSRVTNDLTLAVEASGPVAAALLDSALAVVGEPLPLASDASGALWTNTLPLAARPAASVVAIQTTQAEARVSASVLFSSDFDDSDNDGMPDAWEAAHGLAPHDASDAVLDPDGDGLSNLAEYRAGTDPRAWSLDPSVSIAGLVSEFFSFGTNALSVFPASDSASSAFVRIDTNINYVSSRAAWPGLSSDLFTDRFALRASGYLRIPVSGAYTLGLCSDDGSRLWVDGVSVIGNDGLHRSLLKTATLALAAGDHPVRVEYFENTFDAECVLSWAVPGCTNLVPVPASAFHHLPADEVLLPFVSLSSPAAGTVYGAGNLVPLVANASSFRAAVVRVGFLVDGVPVASASSAPWSAVWASSGVGSHVVAAVATDTSGLSKTSSPVRVSVVAAPVGYAYGVASSFYSYSTNVFPSLPPAYWAGLSGFPVLLPACHVLDRVDNQIDFPVTAAAWPGLPADVSNRFATVHESGLWVRKSGIYTLTLRSDDGSRLLLDGVPVIRNGGCHGMADVSCTTTLVAGVHSLRVEFFANDGLSGLILFWAGPGFARRVVEPTVLLRADGSADTDGDGLPDWYEAAFGLDPAVAATAATDTDTDGIPDLQEYAVTGTDPSNPDTDGDGMPDGWEFAHGLDPLDPADVALDPDLDGLSNLSEYRAGTDPRRADTDGDGLSDGVEVCSSRTDPLVADIAGGSPLAASDAVPGDSAASSTGSWRSQDGFIHATERAGSLTYRLAVTNSPDALAVTVAQHNSLSMDGRFDLSLRLDGVLVSRLVVYAPYGSPVDAVFFLPALDPGEHDFRLVWNNLENNTFLEVRSLRLVTYGGPDADGDGVADWRAARAAKDALDPVSASVLVSPLCLEGSGVWRDVLAVGSSYPTNGSYAVVPTTGDGFYADIGLDPSGAPVALALFDGRLTNALSVAWDVLDLGSPANVWTNSPLAVRIGDSLRLLGPAGAAVTVSRAVSTNAWASVTNWTSSVPVAFAFAEAGEYLVESADAFARVSVTSSRFPLARPALVNGGSRTLVCPALAPSALLEHDPDLAVVAGTNSSGAVTLGLSTSSDSEQGLVSRLSGGGAVLDTARAVPVNGDNGAYYRVLQTYADGSQLAEIVLRLGAVPPGLTVKLTVFVSGVMFEDGTRTKTLTAADFDADGVCRYRMIRSAGVTTSVCHYTVFYQNGVQIGAL